MKRIIALTAVFAATLAFTAAPILACGGCGSTPGSDGGTTASATTVSAKYSCGSSASTASAPTVSATSASAKYTCSATGAKATAASYTNCGDNCKLTSGKYAVATMKVDGMTCGGCEATLTGEFMKSEGILWVASVSSVDGTAKVIYDKSNYSEKELVNAISSAGFSGNVISAVAISDARSTVEFANATSGSKTCTAAQRANCTAAQRAACTARKSATAVTNSSGVQIASASKSTCSKSLAKKGGADVSFVSADGVSAKGYTCHQLTSAEHAAFCAQFCSTNSDDTKKSL